MAFKLVSNSFADSGAIPQLHTRDGADVSPSLEWSGEPHETRSFALVMDDPDAPAGTWNHWLLWDIPASVHVLAQGIKAGQLGVSGANDFGKPGYGGPSPPKGHGRHRYFFKLYALDVASIELRAGSKRAELDRALKGHILAQTEYLGHFER